MMKKVFALLMLVILAACAPAPTTQPAAYVDLTDLQPLPTPANTQVKPLRVAIAAVFSPQGSAESYAPLLDYLGLKLGRPIERVQRRTYAEINDLLRTGEVDLAFVCTSSYLLGHKQFGLELLAAPQVNGKVTYNATLIIRTELKAQSIADLRGKTFAFTDPTSFSGRVYPTYLLQQMGTTPEVFFARTFFTYSHDKAIYAVVEGQADAASVDSLVLDFALKRDPTLAQKIRVIHVSPDFGMPPVVVSPSIRPQLRAELTDILLGMNLDPAGLAALQALDYDRFVVVSDQDYRSAKEVQSAVDLNGNP